MKKALLEKDPGEKLKKGNEKMRKKSVKKINWMDYILWALGIIAIIILIYGIIKILIK